MPTSCCVAGCTKRHETGASLSFAPFPVDPERRKLWVQALRRVNADGSKWEPGASHRVCGEHFVSGRPSKDKNNVDYIPTLCLGYETRAERETTAAGQARGSRAEKRAAGAEEAATAARAEAMAARAEEEAERERRVFNSRMDHGLFESGAPAAKRVAHASSGIKLRTVTSLSDLPIPLLCDAAVNTELHFSPAGEGPAETIASLERDVSGLSLKLKAEVDKSSKMVEMNLSFGVHLIVDKDSKTRFYTGLPSYGVFKALVKYLTPKARELREWRGEKETAAEARSRRPFSDIPIELQLFAVLARLRLNMKGQDLADRLGATETTVSRLFTTWVIFLSLEFQLLFPWPKRALVASWMPESFLRKYPNTRVIIDCMEFQVQRPSRLMSQSQTYSSYKSRNTFKLLVGVSPSGLVTFLSDLWGGRVSDREITKSSGLLDLLEPGDSVMADRGFDIQDILAEKGVTLNIPPRLQGRAQFAVSEVEKTRRIAELRIHVERAIGRARRFEILNATFPIAMAPIVNHVVKVCFLITNFDRRLVE